MSKSALIQALNGHTTKRIPVWFMRQAGRYLPEYRELRQKAGSFLNLCFSPDMACEVTLQPLHRYDLDAAILFADILLLPMFMGQNLTFEAGEGPRLRPALQDSDLALADKYVRDGVAPIMETVKLCAAALGPEKALIGFAGAPWTVATYMIAGSGVKDPSALRLWAYENEEAFSNLIELLQSVTIQYLCDQIEAGAQVVQLFESWAAGLPVDFLKQYSLEPCRRIAQAIKAKHPDIPVITFPKGAGSNMVDYAKADVFDGLGIDSATDPIWAAEYLSPHVTVQGGLDQLLVVAGGDKMERSAETLLRAFDGKPYIFNLGHGFVPQTPPENVARLIEIIRQ